MYKLFSKKDPEILCHVIHRLGEINNRTNISKDDQFLQVAALKMREGDTFKPHKHIWKESPTKYVIAQESWVVIKGSVTISCYDIDGTFLEKHMLLPGDISITYEGGHTYLANSDDTIVYEYKTGPYEGIEKDKVFI